MRESERNKNPVRRLFEEAYTNYIDKTLDEVLTTDYVHHPTRGADLHGREALRRSMIKHEEAFPNGRVQIESMVCEGEMIATRLTFYLVHRGNFWGIEPTGNSLRLKEMMFHRVKDGLIAEGWNIADRLGIAQQLGVAPDRSLPPALRHV